MQSDILEMVNAMIEESRKTIQQIADEIGKPYPTLKRELNEFDEGAKLGARILYPIARACNATDRLAAYFAHRAGGQFRKHGCGQPDAESMSQECLQAHHAMAAFTDAADADADYDTLCNLLSVVIKESEDVVKRKAEQARKKNAA